MTPPELSLREARDIVLNGLKGYAAKVYLFGSRARGDAGRISDIDIGILPQEPIPGDIFVEISEAIEDSCIPYDVDIVDLSKVSDDFRERVFKEGILWNNAA